MHTECCCRRCCCCCCVAMLCCCCCCSCCCCCLLLLFLIVWRTAKFVAGSLHLIPVFYFSRFKRYLFLMCTLAVMSHLRPRFAYNTSSIIAGVRGTKAGVSMPRRSPRCTSHILRDSVALPFLYMYPGLLYQQHYTTAPRTSDLVTTDWLAADFCGVFHCFAE